MKGCSDGSSDLLEGLVDDVKLLCLLRQLGPNVTSEEDALKVHPLALDNHPHLGSRDMGGTRSDSSMGVSGL